MLTPELKTRYSPGGDLYNQLTARYGRQAAEDAYQAALHGDQADVAEALRRYRGLEDVVGTSSIGNFFKQIITDPLAAPLDSANDQIGKAIANVFKNPWVLLVVAALFFHQFGGFDWLSKKYKLA